MQRAIRRSTQLSKAKVFTNVIAVRSVQSLKKTAFPSSNFVFKSATSINNYRLNSIAHFSSYPPHKVVPMPSLSPTMEVGSIARWILKEGDKFEAGSAICEVETDKATVSFDATDDGYIAKIFVGTGDVKVGEPLMITVEEESEVAAFANYKVEAASAPIPAAPVAAPKAAPVAAPVAQHVSAPVASSSAASNGSRIFASPLAKKLAKEAGVNLATTTGSGPNGRIVAADVQKAASMPKAAAPAPVVAAAQPVAPAAKQIPITSVGGVFADFVLSDVAQSIAARQTLAKQQVPHYYLSVELNLTNLLALRETFNKSLVTGKKGVEDSSSLSVQDFLIKAAALAMKQVPDVNASWMDTFVRRYHQVDINLIVGAGSFIATPVIRDVNSKGLSAIAAEVSSFEDALFAQTEPSAADDDRLAVGTFSVHNLGIYGVKSAAPIVLTPQSCALSLGAIVDTVIPKVAGPDGGDNWQVAPVLTATLSCDHRVVDGAVGAQWLAAYKSYVENPVTMLL